MQIEDAISGLVDPKKTVLSGTLGLSASVVKITNRPTYVWVRLLSNPNEAVQAENRTVSPKWNLPVTLEYDGKKYIVTGIDTDRYPNWGSDNALLPDHAYQHSMIFRDGGGGDVVWVDSQQFIPGLAMPQGVTGSSTIHLMPFKYLNSQDIFFDCGDVDLEVAPSSTTGTSIQTLILSDADGTTYWTEGPCFIYNVSGSVNSYIPARASASDKYLFGALRHTQVSGTVIDWNDMVDLRQFVGGGSGGSLPTLDPDRVVITDPSGQIATDPGLVYDSTNRALTVGDAPAPVQGYKAAFQVVADGLSALSALWSWGTGASSLWSAFSSRGTKVAPEAVQSGDILMRIQAVGYDGVNTPETSLSATRIAAVADENFDETSHGSKFEFYTTPRGSTTKTLAMTIGSDQNPDLPLGQTYNINGIPHSHETGGSRWEPVVTGGPDAPEFVFSGGDIVMTEVN